MSYTHPTTKHEMTGFNSHEEHVFFNETTKRQMFLIIEQMASLLKEDELSWVEKAIEERDLLKKNGIK